MLPWRMQCVRRFLRLLKAPPLTEFGAHGNLLNVAGTISDFMISTTVSYAHLAVESASWIIDIRASDHMCCNFNMFPEIFALNKPALVRLPDGNTKAVTKIGIVRLKPTLTLCHVL